jgi:type IV pilus assembly protein PilB
MAKTFGERIADVLIEDGLLLPAQLDEVMALQKEQGGKLVKLLTEKGYVTEQDMVISMGRCLDVPPINVAKVRIPDDIADLVPKEMARSYKLAPICRLGNKLFVAMADPMNVLAIDDVRQRTRLDVVPMICTEKGVMDALAGTTGGGVAMDQMMKDAAEEASIGLEEVTEEKQPDLDLQAGSGEDGPVIKIVNAILMQALKEKASDIHVEPFEKHIKLRYRIDGNLVEASSPPKALQLPMASRLKIMAGLDISERRLPQDGRFRIRVSGKEIDLRVSFLPTVHGEKIVLRILDKSALSGSVKALGLDDYTMRIFQQAIDAPHGMILVTGPTGSGKTTTLYSVLQELNNPEYNIVTVEDPVEYQLVGINQVPVKADVGLTFAAALRSILRQDPDIVMIGEIRDQETADIAVKAALTGHQVLSTLHTNDAAGAISRLDDMGIEPFLISSSVLLTCAQRLVRRICNNCKEEFTPPAELFQKLEVEHLSGETFFRGAGCDRCNGRGYAGRAAVLEVLPVSEAIRKLVIKRASASVVKAQAVQEGMKTLRMVGIDKAMQGITSLEEVLRTTTDDH